ncbi:hypothetical protein [Rothia sp. HMSC058E10]|uniref:hypothetical protein n=1 Tax=Rothia sp. HMSC058E10 TaxID=1715088 RepID=UPI000AFEBD83|nr:hypothetical protein [Rothia sp. HMSC058E10]
MNPRWKLFRLLGLALGEALDGVSDDDVELADEELARGEAELSVFDVFPPHALIKIAPAPEPRNRSAVRRLTAKDNIA